MPSTAIDYYSYDEARRELHVRFRGGGDYLYRGVPPEEYAALKAARSKGSYVNKVIKPRHDFERRSAAPRRIWVED